MPRPPCRRLKKEAWIVFEQAYPGFHSGWERLRFSLIPVCDAQGAVMGAMIFGEDITELNRAQQAIGESENAVKLYGPANDSAAVPPGR